MESVGSIIQKKEREGALVQGVFRVAAGVLYSVVTTFIHVSRTELYLGILSGALYAVAGGVLLWRSRKVDTLRTVNLAGVVLDFWIVLAVIYLLNVSVGTDVPFSFILKSDVYPITILLLIFHMISLRPGVVILSGVGFFVINLSTLLASLYLAGSTPDVLEAFTGYRVNVDFELGRLVLFLVLVATVSYLSYRNRSIIFEAAEAEVRKNRLGSYFSPAVLDQIVEGSGLPESGRVQEAAILFSDIEGFTSFSEKLPPEEVVKFLREYHELMVGAIFHYKGTVDKFVGDAIMASFGTPVSGEGDVVNAVSAVVEMEKRLGEFNRQRVERGEVPVRHRIGLHYGEVITGNIGSGERLEYTVIGDTVNTASRIESANKRLGTGVLVSERIVAAIGPLFPFRYVGRVKLKGKSEIVTLYTIDPAQ